LPVALASSHGDGTFNGLDWMRDTGSVPVPLVARIAVTPVIVVAAAPLPVEAPAWIPELAGAPVVVREGCGLGFGDGGRPQTSEP
jgi:hypothetical protein